MRKILLFLIAVLFYTNAFAVTQLRQTVCPSGCNATSLETVLNANEKNLVTADQYFDIEISGNWSSPDTTLALVHNYVTDATHYINITAIGDARCDGSLNKNGSYVIDAGGSTTAPFRTTIGNVTLDGITLKNSTGTGISEVAAAPSNRYSNLVLFANGSGSDLLYFQQASNGTAYNVVCYGTSRCISSAGAGNATVYNSHARGNGDYGFLRQKYINCYSGGHASGDFLQIVTAGSDYLVSSDTTSNVVAHNATGKNAYTTYFVNNTSDLRLTNTSQVLWGMSGLNESAIFTTDINGTTRSSWDIGAYEYPASGGSPPSAPVFDNLSAGLQYIISNWTASTGATKYYLNRGTSTGSYDNITDVGNVTTYNSTGLADGTQYFIGIMANNVTGNSSMSNELNATTNASVSPQVITSGKIIIR